MSNGIAPTPTHGAAYKVLLERCVIENCSTPERFAEIEKTLKGIRAWAADQPHAVKSAYDWAAMKVEGDARSRLKLFQNSTSVFSAYESIPKPPQ